MNLTKKIRSHKKLGINVSVKPNTHKVSLSSVVLRNNLINLERNSFSSFSRQANHRKVLSLIKNYDNDYNEIYYYVYLDKSPLNLTSTEIKNESSLINNFFQKTYIKPFKYNTNTLIKKNLKNINTNIFNNKFIEKKKKNCSPPSIGNNNAFITNNKNIEKRCRHKQVKREIYTNNDTQKDNSGLNKAKINKRNSLNNLVEAQTNPNSKNITIPIKKRIKENYFLNSNKNKPLYSYILLKKKFNKKSIKSNVIEDHKDNKENIEINDKSKIFYFKRNTINFKVKRVKSPQNNNINLNNKKTKTIYGHRNSGKMIESAYYKKNLKENEKENDEILFNENELNENMLSKNLKPLDNKKGDFMINKVFYFKTENNKMFNQLYRNNSIDDNIPNNKQNLKNIEDKKESCSTIISSINNYNEKEINNKENEIIKNVANVIKNNLDYKVNKKKEILRKNSDASNLKKILEFKPEMISVNDSYNHGFKNIKTQNNKEENKIFFSPENNNYPSQTISKENMHKKKVYKSINLNIDKKKIKSPNYSKNIFNEILSCDKFLKIFFSFCTVDIALLNKFSLLSKKIYMKIKPIIYKKINETIFKYNNDINNKNRIKKYLMKNHSSLIKLSPVILRKKYTDLIFENNNKYDLDIKKDLTRTFPNNELFKYGNIYYNKLYHILTAYSNFNKNIGYIQGLNFLAAHIIYFFEDEIDEFIFLDALIHKFNLDKILDNNLNNKYFEIILENINSFIIKMMPGLNEFLSNIKLNISFFTTNWVLTLFSDSMDTEYISIIWDYMIIFGWKFFNFFILNILTMFESDLLNSTQNNITFIKKNIFRNQRFKNNFHKLIKDTLQIVTNDEIII